MIEETKQSELSSRIERQSNALKGYKSWHSPLLPMFVLTAKEQGWNGNLLRISCHARLGFTCNHASPMQVNTGHRHGGSCPDGMNRRLEDFENHCRIQSVRGE
eukprot:scaffold898_cov168-Amphora_coffeaeformis.AAC.8